MDLKGLQQLLFPAAIGTIAIVGSCVAGIFEVSAIRYSDKSFEHPYKPWSDDHNDKEGRHYRGFKACMNTVEWAVYTIPLQWVFTIYTPSIPFVGPYSAWVSTGLALTYAYFNKQYVPSYMTSAKDRIPPFRNRTLAFRCIAFGAIGGVCYSGAQALELVN